MQARRLTPSAMRNYEVKKFLSIMITYKEKKRLKCRIDVVSIRALDYLWIYYFSYACNRH